MKLNKKILIFILILGTIARVSFLFIGGDLYYGPDGRKYANNDTFSYTESFKNLWQHGAYTHTIGVPDATFGRLPSYPFYWGVHYILFGEYTPQAIAVSQVFLDILAIWLLMISLYRAIGRMDAAYLGGIIYALYPFIIVWNTMTSTESFCTFLVILIYYLVSINQKFDNNKFTFILGIILGVGTLTRPYLFLLFILITIYLFIKVKSEYLPKFGILVLSFTLIYALWPLRNYINHGKVVFIKVGAAGYIRYSEDVTSARAYILSATNDSDDYLDKIADPKAEVEFPEDLVYNDSIRRVLDNLVELCRKCGKGFYIWHNDYHRPRIEENCNHEIFLGFERLRKNFIAKEPLIYWTKTPILNINKALFKGELSKRNKEKFSSHLKNILAEILFKYRSLLVLLGFMGVIIVIWRRNYLLMIPSFFGIGLYFFICVIVRQLEMRYLLQADVMLLIPAVYFLMFIYNRINFRGIFDKVK